MLQPRGHISPWYIVLIIIVVAGAFIVAFTGRSDDPERIVELTCEEARDIVPANISQEGSLPFLLAHASQLNQNNTWTRSMITGDILIADIITTQNAQDYLFACMRTYFDLSDREMNMLWNDITALVFVEEWQAELAILTDE